MLTVTQHVTQACNDKREVVLPAAHCGLACRAGRGANANCGQRFLQANMSACHEPRPNRCWRSSANCITCPCWSASQPIRRYRRRAFRSNRWPIVWGRKTAERCTSCASRRSEPVFNIIKQVMDWRQMSMRGLAKAQGEWSLVPMAWNIKRLHVLRVA